MNENIFYLFDKHFTEKSKIVFIFLILRKMYGTQDLFLFCVNYRYSERNEVFRDKF